MQTNHNDKKPWYHTHQMNEWMNECRAIIISSNWFAWEIRFITNVQKCSDSKCKLPDIPSVMEENRRIKNKPERNRIDCQRPAIWNPIQLRCDSNIYKRVVGASSFLCLMSFRKTMPKCALMMQFMQEMWVRVYFLPFHIFFCSSSFHTSSLQIV